MSFLHGGLLFGALLFAVPLIIHLLNRQRHRKRPWAAMDFLIRAYRKTRSRLRNENLLLLLLRCLIPVVLAFAIARPVLRETAALVGPGRADHHVVVVDSTYSTGFQRDGGQSSFDRARALVGRLLEKLQDGERADEVTLVTAGVRPRFLVRGEQNLPLARAQWLEVQRPEDADTDLTAALAQVADALEEGGDGPAQVYVVTDMQGRAFGKALTALAPADPGAAPEPQFQDTLRDVVERLQARDGTVVHLIDVGPFAEQRTGGVADNLQLAGLALDQPAAVARLPVTVRARLRNLGTATAVAQVTLEIDGGEPVRKVVGVEPGGEAEAEFQVTFRETGPRRLRAAVQNDGLAADDEWFAVVDVRERIRVLVVDGAADRDPLQNQEFFYRAFLDPVSLEPGGDQPADLARFEVFTCDTLALLSGQQVPSAYDLTVLGDVDRLNERAAAGVLQALQAGKGLLVAFGEHTDPESFNLHLFGIGDGPMPFRLARRMGSERGAGVPRMPVIAAPEHPVLAEFQEEVYREILQGTPVYEWFGSVADTLREDAAVVLQLTDRDQSPLLVTAGHGEGRAAFLTSAPGPQLDPDRWNQLESPFVVYPLLHGLCQWLALPRQDPFNAAVGAALTCTLPARPADVEVVLPERAGGRKVPVSEDPRPLPGGRYAMPAFANTTLAGFYVCDLQLEHDSGREPWSRPFAVHVEPEEGRLEYAPHESVREALGVDRVLTALPSEVTGSVDARGSELGPTFLRLLLLLVVGEAAMARYVSGRRN